jgi:hypothetical protein
MPEYSDDKHEMLQRTRRIETRLMKLCNFLGLDPSRDRDRVIVKRLTPLTLDIAGLDVSLGDLLDACRKAGITHTAAVECRGVLLATIILGDVDAARNTAADGTQTVG